MMRHEEIKLIAETLSTLPALFGLYAFPGKVFRASESASYVNDAGTVMVYTQVQKKIGRAHV